MERDATELEFKPLTPGRWPDFEALFGERGAYGGCWCMWWRTTRSQFQQQQGEGNRKAMRAIVRSGTVPGILAYDGARAVGWCSIAPRGQYGSLNRSPVLKPLDEKPVWSLVCLFVHRDHRQQGVATALIGAAVDYVREQGGKVVEAYPTVPREDRLPPVSSYMGIPAMFERAGFVATAHPSQSRIVMRFAID